MDKRIILIADDDEMSRAVIQRNFSDVYDVYEAENGEKVLELIHSTPIDIVILDIVMPKVNGYEVLQQVKCDEKYSDMKVLVATSLLEKTERKALELGADDIVFKPYDPIVIKKRIDNLLTMQQQKRELEAALIRSESANKAKTQFLSRISHDMRTPLNGILGIAALMKEKITDPKQYEDLLQMEASGKYLLNLVNDTLDVNKIEIGKLELHPDVFDGRTAVNNVISLIKTDIDRKQIHFVVDAENLPYTKLYMDMGRLEQVILNILGNAVKFTPQGGTIRASMKNLSREGNILWDRIVISDNGVGMSREFLPHLYEAFTQENPGNTGNTTGTGLGMMITKQLVDIMGGTIAVESQLGVGTTFTIDLPLPIATDEQVAEWTSRQKIYSGNISFAGKKVLLCEDHPLNAEITIRILERKHVIVEHAVNGKIGLEMFEKSAPGYYDLIFMDIRMPEMDGIEATRQIRRLDRPDARRVPIVAMTANAFNEDIDQIKAAGMDDYLSKPLDVELMFRCMAEQLRTEHLMVRKQILIVDDIALNREVIKTILDREFDVFEAQDGLEALEILRERRGITLVITDIQMPRMNGLKLIQEIRKVREYDNIAIIANTQFGDPEQEEQILRLGADDFVYKPTTPKIIELRVRNVINRL